MTPAPDTDRMHQPIAQRWYSTPEAAELTNHPPHQLDRWVRLGLITPTGGRAAGSGHRHRWTRSDIERLRTIRARLDWGMTLDAAFRTEDPPVPAPGGAS